MKQKEIEEYSLKRYFGKKYPYFIDYLMKQSESIIKLFKLKFGEDLDIENPFAVLSELDKQIIYCAKRDFIDEFIRKEKVLGISVKKEEHIENIYSKQILRILSPFGNKLSTIFDADNKLIEDLTFVFGKELLKNIVPYSLLDNIKALITHIKKNINRLFLDFPLNNQLIEMGYNNEEINKKALSRLHNRMTKILYKKYGMDLCSVHEINEDEKKYLVNIIIPVFLTKLEKYYIENRRLNLIEKYGHDDFIKFMNYVREKFPESIILFNELFGNEKMYSFNLEHNLSANGARKVLEISGKYNSKKEKSENDSTEKNGVPFSTSPIVINYNNQIVTRVAKDTAFKEVVTLLIRYEDGTGVTKNYTLTDNIHILAKYEKLLVSTELGEEIYKHSKGDTFKIKIEGSTQIITIIDKTDSKNKRRFIIPTSVIIRNEAIDEISRHVDDIGSDYQLKNSKH